MGSGPCASRGCAWPTGRLLGEVGGAPRLIAIRMGRGAVTSSSMPRRRHFRDERALGDHVHLGQHEHGEGERVQEQRVDVPVARNGLTAARPRADATTMARRAPRLRSMTGPRAGAATAKGPWSGAGRG